MGLMDVLRKAEEQSKNAARRGKELARATLNESGRRLRRKMRVNPPSNSAALASEPAVLEPQPTSASLSGTSPVQDAGPRAAEAVRKKIVSINGHDVRTEDVRTEDVRTEDVRSEEVQREARKPGRRSA